MDKRTIIGLVVIGLIIIFYPVYMEWITGGKKAPVTPPPAVSEVDTTSKLPPPAQELKEISPSEVTSKTSSLIPLDTLSEEKIVKVETDLYTAEFSTKGAVLKSFILKKYTDQDKNHIQLIPSDAAELPLNLVFPDSNISLESFNFQADKDQLVLDKPASTGEINFLFTTQSGIQIIKRYDFHNGKYDFNLEFEVSGSGQLDLGREYLLGWAAGLKSTEKNRSEDLGYFAAFSMMGTEMSEIKKFNQPKGAAVGTLQETASGETKWVATRSKYFVAAMVPLTRKGIGFSTSGIRYFTTTAGVQVEHKRIGVSVGMPLEKQATLKDKYMIYVGPIDYMVLKSYGADLDRMVNMGWKIIRPFSIGVMWFLVNLHKIIPNYGLVIIIFTILIKIVFHPLTHKSTKANLKMQELQPKIAQLKEKLKKDPTRLNQETMKLYKSSGVNPLGGCLPLLFQMPIFYALFVVFRSTIELRGASFAFWLTDLSQKDPYYILPIIMSGTMFWQQKITIKDPKQAMLVYFMPIMFFFFFYNFPAGLTLYWTMFNIMSLIETYYFKHKGLTPSAVSAQPAKESR
ncbi:MAG TPA: membrane protein insertase YidC [candidate division Zixibacteria bacterium]